MAGMAKNYTMPIDAVLYDMSVTNIHLYNAVLPSYSSEKSKKKNDGEVVKADDPRNREKMMAILKQINTM